MTCASTPALGSPDHLPNCWNVLRAMNLALTCKQNYLASNSTQFQLAHSCRLCGGVRKVLRISNTVASAPQRSLNKFSMTTAEFLCMMTFTTVEIISLLLSEVI